MWWIGAVPKSAESQYEMMPALFLMLSLFPNPLPERFQQEIVFYSFCGKGMGIV